MPSMTYIIQARFASELNARKDYLFNSYHLYFVDVEKNDFFIKLKSFPFLEDNIVMLYGHFNWVLEYFQKYGAELRDKIKIINSCFPKIVIPKLNQKNIYYSKVNQRGEACCYSGNDFGLSFDITDSELDALNTSHLELMNQIEFSYEKVA